MFRTRLEGCYTFDQMYKDLQSCIDKDLPLTVELSPAECKSLFEELSGLFEADDKWTEECGGDTFHDKG